MPGKISLSVDFSDALKKLDKLKSKALTAKDVVPVIQEQIVTEAKSLTDDEGAIGVSGDFRRSIHAGEIVQETNKTIFYVRDGVFYGKYLEFGTKKHFVPIWREDGTLNSLGIWMNRKLGIPIGAGRLGGLYKKSRRVMMGKVPVAKKAKMKHKPRTLTDIFGIWVGNRALHIFRRAASRAKPKIVSKLKEMFF